MERHEGYRVMAGISLIYGSQWTLNCGVHGIRGIAQGTEIEKKEREILILIINKSLKNV